LSEDRKQISVLLERNAQLTAENLLLREQKQSAARSNRRFSALKHASNRQLKEWKAADDDSQLKIAKLQRALDELQVQFDLAQFEKAGEAAKETVIYFYQYCDTPKLIFAGICGFN
jgi:hypothetical protein